jgi:hypothetical protein
MKLISGIKSIVEDFEIICKKDIFDIPIIGSEVPNCKEIEDIYWIGEIRGMLKNIVIEIQEKTNEIKRPDVNYVHKNEFKQSDPEPWPYDDDLTWEPEGFEEKYTKLCNLFLKKKMENKFEVYCKKTGLFAMICIIIFSFLVSAGGIAGMLGIGSPYYLVVIGLFFLVGGFVFGVAFGFFSAISSFWETKSKKIGMDKMKNFYQKAMNDFQAEKKIQKDIWTRNNGEAKWRKLKLEQQKTMIFEKSQKKEVLCDKFNDVIERARLEIFKIASELKFKSDKIIDEQEIVEIKIGKELSRYLKTLKLVDLNFGKIKKRRKESLIKSGIVTVLDINEKSIENVVGFGKILREEIMLWKLGVVNEFLEKSGYLSNEKRRKNIEDKINLFVEGSLEEAENVIFKFEHNAQSFKGEIFDINKKLIRYKAMVEKSEIECSFIPDCI